MAALRGGMTTVIIPAQNAPDLEEIDPNVRAKLQFVTAESMDTVLAHALTRIPEPLPAADAAAAAPDAHAEPPARPVPIPEPKPSALPQ